MPGVVLCCPPAVPQLPVAQSESDRYSVSEAGDGRVRGVIGPQETVVPTKDDFTVAASAGVPPENVAELRIQDAADFAMAQPLIQQSYSTG